MLSRPQDLSPLGPGRDPNYMHTWPPPSRESDDFGADFAQVLDPSSLMLVVLTTHHFDEQIFLHTISMV